MDSSSISMVRRVASERVPERWGQECLPLRLGNQAEYTCQLDTEPVRLGIGIEQRKTEMDRRKNMKRCGRLRAMEGGRC